MNRRSFGLGALAAVAVVMVIASVSSRAVVELGLPGRFIDYFVTLHRGPVRCLPEKGLCVGQKVDYVDFRSGRADLIEVACGERTITVLEVEAVGCTASGNYRLTYAEPDPGKLYTVTVEGGRVKLIEPFYDLTLP